MNLINDLRYIALKEKNEATETITKALFFIVTGLLIVLIDWLILPKGIFLYVTTVLFIIAILLWLCIVVQKIKHMRKINKNLNELEKELEQQSL